jgi:hypothetical protein
VKPHCSGQKNAVGACDAKIFRRSQEQGVSGIRDRITEMCPEHGDVLFLPLGYIHDHESTDLNGYRCWCVSIDEGSSGESGCGVGVWRRDVPHVAEGERVSETGRRMVGIGRRETNKQHGVRGWEHNGKSGKFG